jgi:ceramide glucosyltransferase
LPDFTFFFLLYIFVLVQLWLGILSLCGGFQFRAYVVAELKRAKAEYFPKVVILLPCKGLDQGLGSNLRSFLSLDYPDYRVVFIVDDIDDPAVGVIRDAIGAAEGKVNAQLVVAGEASSAGQKIHNLITGLGDLEATDEVLVFADSDARPVLTWLTALVEPLADERVGAATGYRWFVPASGSIAANLLSVWNASIASTLGSNSKRNFCWGGSTAIRRTTFDRVQVVNRWQGAVSDDFMMMQALKEAEMPIHFVPQCLTPTFEDSNWPQLLKFTTRQIKITRVYAPVYWRAVLIGSVLFVGVSAGLLADVFMRTANQRIWLFQFFMLFLIFALGSAKSVLRLSAVAMVLKVNRLNSAGNYVKHILLWPMASILFLFNSLAAMFSRRITWRGITYQLISMDKTVIIRDRSQ